MATDNQLRSARGHRSLFTFDGGERWGLSEWGLSERALSREQQILSLSEELRQEAVRTLGDGLKSVGSEAIEHIALTLLERMGYTNIKVSKRSSEGDVYFSADWRQGLADVRVCIQVNADDSRRLEVDDVVELRGTLHHYAASEGVIITLGRVEREAIGESREEKLSPITLIDRDTFVELLIRNGIGTKAYTTPIIVVDTGYIEALRR